MRSTDIVPDRLANQRRALLVVALVVCSGAGCAVQHIRDYTPKERKYVSPVDLAVTETDATNGSLFSPTHNGNFLFADQRARLAGDILTINVVEDADANHGARTELSRDSGVDLSITSFLGLIKLLGNNLDDKLVAGSTKSDFLGRGDTSRTDHMRATVPAMVKQVLANGNLFIEGHRVILVNDEEHHFYVSGVIRPVDILDDNSIDSSRIADAEIEFTGRGVISEKQSPGWLTRAIDVLTPF